MVKSIRSGDGIQAARGRNQRRRAVTVRERPWSRSGGAVAVSARRAASRAAERAPVRSAYLFQRRTPPRLRKQGTDARRGLDAAKRLLALYIKHQCAQRDCVRKPPPLYGPDRSGTLGDSNA